MRFVMVENVVVQSYTLSKLNNSYRDLNPFKDTVLK
jgi:hypothetical protein